MLGYDGLLRLLSSGAFEIDLSYASIAYLREVDEGFGSRRPLPPLSYAFRAWRPLSWAGLREQRIKECVSCLPDLNARQRQQLEEALDTRVLAPASGLAMKPSNSCTPSFAWTRRRRASVGRWLSHSVRLSPGGWIGPSSL